MSENQKVIYLNLLCNYNTAMLINCFKKFYWRPWSEGLEKFILYAFCPSPPLCNVDKTLSSNTSFHFIIFQHWKGEWGCWHLFCRYYGYDRVAMVGEKSGKVRFSSRSGKSQVVLYQVWEFLNPCSKSVKSQGILF